jgi:hypothetical protein
VSTETLEAGLVRALERPEAYPLDPSARQGIEHRQTHLSHVFLTCERVYKLHKAATFQFVDFSSRAERDADALREVALNRRLAGDVYLGVAPARRRSGAFLVGETGESLAPDALEHCVVMRRLPEGRDGRSLLEAGRLDRAMVSAVAERIADFHRGARLGSPAPFPPPEWLRRSVDPFLVCCRELERKPHEAQARLLLERAQELAARLAPALERRRLAGRAVDGHGDLHLEHLWFLAEGAVPIAIDCIAFREDLRRIDAAADVAFLQMDLCYRGARALSEHFLQEYASHADDHDLYAVVDFHAAYRAAVRAKVAALATGDRSIPAEQRERAARSASDHLALARELLEPPGPGRVVAVGGLVGTGKTTVARALAAELDGVVVSSDRVRKALSGIAPATRARADFGAGLYDRDHTEAVYAELRQRAGTIVDAGRVAILDASFADRRQRDRLRTALAPRRPILVEVECAPERAIGRLGERARAAQDPSDAGPELYAAFARAYQPPDEWPPEDRHRLPTDGSWREPLRALAASIARAPAS